MSAAAEPGPAEGLSHVDASGSARMVDVGGKPVSQREAVARAALRCQPATISALAEGALAKGDALAVARIAGIQAAKRTPELLPLCHSVALSAVEVDVRLDIEAGLAEVTATARAADRTGVEMEALVAAATGALALYDMVKSIERGAVIERVELVAKHGGVRGDWRRDREGSSQPDQDEGGGGPRDGAGAQRGGTGADRRPR